MARSVRTVAGRGNHGTIDSLLALEKPEKPYSVSPWSQSLSDTETQELS
jgi:hypothetical protein